MSDQVGAVLTFGAGVDEEDVINALRALNVTLEISSQTVKTFDSDHGSPVFYIP